MPSKTFENILLKYNIECFRQISLLNVYQLEFQDNQSATDAIFIKFTENMDQTRKTSFSRSTKFNIVCLC